MNDTKIKAFNQMLEFYNEYKKAFDAMHPLDRNDEFFAWKKSIAEINLKNNMIDVAKGFGVTDSVLLLRSVASEMSIEQMSLLCAAAMCDVDIENIAYPFAKPELMLECIKGDNMLAYGTRSNAIIVDEHNIIYLNKDRNGYYTTSLLDEYRRYRDTNFVATTSRYEDALNQALDFYGIDRNKINEDKYVFIDNEAFNAQVNYSIEIVRNFAVETHNTFNSIDGLGVREIEQIVNEYIEGFLSRYDIDAAVRYKAMLVGSRARGIENENSDIDVVFEYEGDISEDGLFNLLNGEDGLSISGIKVDINPIRADKSGPLHEYLLESDKYLKLKETEIMKNKIDSKFHFKWEHNFDDASGCIIYDGDMYYIYDRAVSPMSLEYKKDSNSEWEPYFGEFNEFVKMAEANMSSIVKEKTISLDQKELLMNK